MSTVAEIKEKIKRNGLPNQTKTNSSDSKSSGYTGSSRYQEIKRNAKGPGRPFAVQPGVLFQLRNGQAGYPHRCAHPAGSFLRHQRGLSTGSHRSKRALSKAVTRRIFS